MGLLKSYVPQHTRTLLSIVVLVWASMFPVNVVEKVSIPFSVWVFFILQHTGISRIHLGKLILYR